MPITTPLEALTTTMSALVPDTLREQAQRELRDRDLFPRDALHELPGPACREAHAAVLAWLLRVTDSERQAFRDWLGPSMPANTLSVPERAATLALWLTLERGFYCPRAIFERDENRRGRALDLVAGLRDAHDDDRLVRLDFFDEVTPHYLRSGTWYLQYHPFLRRYLNSGINVDFTSLLCSSRERKELLVRVAIDTDRITTRPLNERFEFDYWYGPKLTRESLDDPRALGTTRHGRPDGLSSYWAWPLEATEFWWTGDQTRKWLQIEELVPASRHEPTALSGPLAMNRYLHSERDTSRRVFTHLDGAIRAYEPGAYESRRAKPIHRAGHAGRYRKVFRIDGPLLDDDWYQLVVMFYRQNEMVAEYLHPGFQRAVAARNNWPDHVRSKMSPPAHSPAE